MRTAGWGKGPEPGLRLHSCRAHRFHRHRNRGDLPLCRLRGNSKRARTGVYLRGQRGIKMEYSEKYLHLGERVDPDANVICIYKITTDLDIKLAAAAIATEQLSLIHISEPTRLG